MEDEAPVIYGLEFPARALTAQTAETEYIRFLVGTQSLRGENQIHHIDFDEENNVINKNVFLHRDGEIWYISASTMDKDILATCYNKTVDSRTEVQASVWRLPSDFDNSMNEDHTTSHQPLQLLCPLDFSDYGEIKCVLWHPTGEASTLLGLADNHILLWDLNVASASAKIFSSTSLEVKGQPKMTSGKWNPHHKCSQLATANDTAIRGWDIRTMQQVYVIENAHGQLVRDLDFNPNKQYYLVSCGDDCKVKFWDVRNPTTPTKTLTDHSHWDSMGDIVLKKLNLTHGHLFMGDTVVIGYMAKMVWSVRYNHFHDQLVLSSSSDSRVILNNVVSLSSEPFGHLVESEENSDSENNEKAHEKPTDGVIATYEEHEDSVYQVDWSTADPWIFASLSYDGRLVINRVPRTEKYKILL